MTRLNKMLFSRFASGMKAALGAGAALYLLVYMGVAVARLAYPFELEWMEGGSLVQMRRILDGKPLYAPPTIEFVPYIYPPLYFYGAALISCVTGFGFVPLRIVSFAASLGCFGLIFLIVKRETGAWFAGVMASGLFAATFELSGAWFDLARVDSLCLLLTLAGLYWARWADSRIHFARTGLCCALAWFTKQTALLIALPCMAYSVFAKRRRALWLLGAFALLTAGGMLMLDAAHHGWVRYYLLTVPRRHALLPKMAIVFWAQDMLRPLAIAFCCGLWHLGSRWSEGRAFWLAAGIGMIGSSWMSRMHSGGYFNVLLPAHAFVAIMFGLAFHHIEQQSRQAETTPYSRIFLYAVCCLQFIGLLYDPAQYIPSKNDQQAGRQLVERLAQIKGEVFIPRHGYLALLAGKPAFAQEMAVFDVMRSDAAFQHRSISAQLRQDMQEAVAKQRFAAIITDYATTEFEPHYQMNQTIFRDAHLFQPVTGIETRPEFIYVPRR